MKPCCSLVLEQVLGATLVYLLCCDYGDRIVKSLDTWEQRRERFNRRRSHYILLQKPQVQTSARWCSTLDDLFCIHFCEEVELLSSSQMLLYFALLFQSIERR